MQLTRTINADKRYYLDEDEIQNVESLIQTMERFNHIKIKLYNCLYDKSFLKRGPLLEETYSSWLKRNYGTMEQRTIIIVPSILMLLLFFPLKRN